MNIQELAKQAGAEYSSNPDEYDVLKITDGSLHDFAALVAAHERDKVTKERDRMCEQCKWRNHENTTLNETNQPTVLGKS